MTDIRPISFLQGMRQGQDLKNLGLHTWVEQHLSPPSPPFLVMNSTLNVGMGLFRRHLIKEEEEEEEEVGIGN